MRFAVFFIKLFSHLPLPLAHLIGAGLGWIVALVPNRNRRISTTNIALCFPELSTQEQSKLVRRSLVETGKTASETPMIWRAQRERLLGAVREVSGLEVVEEAFARGRGVIIVGPHLGSWELVSVFCSAHWPMTSLYRPLRFPALEEVVRHGRERMGARLVPTDARGVRALIEALARNEMIGIPPDQDPRRTGGVFAPFFGVPANTMTLLPRLLKKSKATPVLCFAERLPRGRGFHVHFIAGSPKFADPVPEKAAAAINAAVESCIRMRPEQYQWSYWRFLTRPVGEPRLYRRAGNKRW